MGSTAEGEVKAERGDDLLVDLANIINNPAFGDVVLITKDGDRLWACRILLAARSPVFQNMFMNGVTVESTSSEVRFPSIRTHALLPILEFIHTGALSKYGLSLRNSVDVTYASRYFLLSTLEKLAISFLSAQSVVSLCNGLGRDLPQLLLSAVDMLSLDMDKHILNLLVEAVTCFSQQGENVAGFSQEAMRVYLDMTRSDAMQLSAAEYVRLRCLLMWFAHRISVAAAEALSVYLPLEQPEIVDSGCGADASLLSACETYQNALAALVRPWIPNVNFRRIHPRMVAEFIEPLGIIEPSHLLQIYRFHATFAKDLYLLRWSSGICPPHFSLHEEGSVVECSNEAKTCSFVTTGAPLTRTAGVYEWDFVIERLCHFMGVGFCSANALKECEAFRSWLGYKSYGWILCCTGDLHHDSMSFDDKAAYASEFGEGARINVRICMEKRTCEFKIDNQICGVAWENIPDEVYPAVTMQFPGRVRIEAARHREIKIHEGLKTIDELKAQVGRGISRASL